MSAIWGLFPYPTHAGGEFVDGSIHKAPRICTECREMECLTSPMGDSDEIARCKFGVSYSKVDDERTVLGILVQDSSSHTKRSKRLSRKYPDMGVRRGRLQSAIAAARALGPDVIRDFEADQDRILQDLKSSPEMHRALSDRLRKGFEETLDQSHDFIQLVKLVRGHSEALLGGRHPDLQIEDAAEREANLGAIYFSTELMLLKMDSMKFLREINLAHGNRGRFQIHPLVLKYVRIYRWQAEQKDLRLTLSGECYEHVSLNGEAFGAVIQGLLDNLVKYAPSGSTASIDFEVTDGQVALAFSGLGPRIARDEHSKIFLHGFRAAAARRLERSGMGVGLATAKAISDALDLGIAVSQDPQEHEKYSDRYNTCFRLTVPI